MSGKEQGCRRAGASRRLSVKQVAAPEQADQHHHSSSSQRKLGSILILLSRFRREIQTEKEK
jgi:hypothetical protein